MTEIRSHTGLRGIAALLVVIFHFRDDLHGFADPDGYTGFFATSYVFVDLFFVLSGFILALVYDQSFERGLNRSTYARFLVFRLARIYPLHLLTLAIMVALTIRSDPGAMATQWPDLVQNLTLTQAWGFVDRFVFNYPSWSISAEWMAYICFPLFLAMSRRMVPALLLLASVSLCLGYLWVTGNDLALNERLSLLRGLPAFAVGLLLFRLRDTFASMSGGLLSVAQMVLVASVLLMLHRGNDTVLLVVCFALMVGATWQDRGILSLVLSGRLAVLLGLWSYSIYMLHVPVRHVMYSLFPKFAGFPATDWGGVPFFLTCLVGTLAVSAASYRYFEAPMRRQCRNLYGRRQVA